MRQITHQASLAFAERRNFKLWNTEVDVYTLWDSKQINFYLFGNVIASLNEHWKLFLDSCGYKTQVTKERLNWVLDAFELGRIYQKKGVWYHEDKDGLNKEFKDWMTLKINS